MLTRAEMLGVFAEKLLGGEYPKEQIEKAWKILMTNQFHDILPGSSIHEVFEDCRRDYAKMNAIGGEVTAKLLDALNGAVAADAGTATVWNLVSCESRSPVTVEGVPSERYAVDAQGNALPSAYENGVLTFIPDSLPPMGCKVFALKNGKCPLAPVTAEKDLLENEKLRVAFDENGIITSVFDKANERESIEERGNILTVSLDKCVHETAWNLELNYQKKMWELIDAESIEIAESSALRGVIRIKRRFNKSLITQDITLYAGSSVLEFDTTVDWHESDKVLKAGFDAAVSDTNATYEIAHGAIKRPTHFNTSFDLAQFEVAAHKWADLSEGGYGVSIINDCKYGYDIHNSHMRITLMRAPTCPDRTGDHGINSFKYAFYPHAEDWRASTVSTALAFNVPPKAVYNAESTGGKLASGQPLVSLSAKNVFIDAIKQAQDGRGYIVRVVEQEQRRGRVRLDWSFGFAKVIETNMIEDDAAEIAENGSSFEFSLKPFEVKTFRII